MRVCPLIAVLSCLAALIPSTFAQNDSARELAMAQSSVTRYCKAWGTLDTAARNELVAEVWAESAEYMDPQPVHVAGRSALIAEILKFQKQFPGATFRCTGIQAHHGFVNYTWVMVMADGTERFKGMDFGTLDSTGRLLRIVSFFGAPPSTN